MSHLLLARVAWFRVLHALKNRLFPSDFVLPDITNTSEFLY
jgi:hypothetical protein